MNTSKDKNINLLVDLDCLFDTRLPVIYGLYRQIIPTIMKDDYYRKRVTDQFGSMSHKIFKTFYKKRNKNILKLATPTPMIELIYDYVIEAQTAFLGYEAPHAPIVYINTYPYNLTDEEKKLLVGMLISILPKKITYNLKLVSYSKKELSPKFVREELYTLIKYDTLEWLEYQNAIGELSKYPPMHTMCVAPMIMEPKKPLKEISQHDFEEVRALMSPLTNLIFIQTRYFSIV